MSAILEPPTSVLAVSGDRSIERRLRNALVTVEDAAMRVTDAEDVADVYEEQRYEIGALVVSDDVAEDRNWTVEIGESEDGGARVDVGNVLVVPEPELAYEPADAIELTEFDPIGDLDIEGEARHHEGTDRWTLRAGKDVDREERDFYLASATVDGPARIEARIPDVAHVNDYSKGGLMVRDSNDPAAPYGFVGRTVGRGTELVWRTDADGDVQRSLQNDERTYPWYRIEGAGRTVTCSVSTDGKYWIPLDQRQVDLDDPVTIGLAACSVVPGEPCEATFADVAVTRLQEP